MKKFAKKAISFFLALCFLLSFTVSAYANSIQPRISFAASLQVVSNPTTISISSATGGHAFIVVKNEGNTTITVGHMSVPAGGSVTLGTYQNRSAHKGLWCNIEGYATKTGTSYALTCGLTGSELAKVNEVINANDTWTIIKNCAYFAKTVWNAAYPTGKISGVNPTTLAASIKNQDNYITNPTIPRKNKSEIARHTPTGIIYDSSGAYRS